ncbi:hypothetical protein HDU97_008869 [Phlyctochytrium planicorne]|nr:hypothetical protein HDU97_008869 [Phlyctochytrium planicorne]
MPVFSLKSDAHCYQVNLPRSRIQSSPLKIITPTSFNAVKGSDEGLQQCRAMCASDRTVTHVSALMVPASPQSPKSPSKVVMGTLQNLFGDPLQPSFTSTTAAFAEPEEQANSLVAPQRMRVLCSCIVLPESVIVPGQQAKDELEEGSDELGGLEEGGYEEEEDDDDDEHHEHDLHRRSHVLKRDNQTSDIGFEPVAQSLCQPCDGFGFCGTFARSDAASISLYLVPVKGGEIAIAEGPAPLPVEAPPSNKKTFQRAPPQQTQAPVNKNNNSPPPKITSVTSIIPKRPQATILTTTFADADDNGRLDANRFPAAAAERAAAEQNTKDNTHPDLAPASSGMNGNKLGLVIAGTVAMFLLVGLSVMAVVRKNSGRRTLGRNYHDISNGSPGRSGKGWLFGGKGGVSGGRVASAHQYKESKKERSFYVIRKNEDGTSDRVGRNSVTRLPMAQVDEAQTPDSLGRSKGRRNSLPPIITIDRSTTTSSRMRRLSERRPSAPHVVVAVDMEDALAKAAEFTRNNADHEPTLQQQPEIVEPAAYKSTLFDFKFPGQGGGRIQSSISPMPQPPSSLPPSLPGSRLNLSSWFGRNGTSASSGTDSSLATTEPENGGMLSNSVTPGSRLTLSSWFGGRYSTVAPSSVSDSDAASSSFMPTESMDSVTAMPGSRVNTWFGRNATVASSVSDSSDLSSMAASVPESMAVMPGSPVERRSDSPGPYKSKAAEKSEKIHLPRISTAAQRF